MAAAMALNAGSDYYSILTLLERGRGIIASILMETRIDTSTLDSEAVSSFLKTREKLNFLQPAIETELGDLNNNAVHPSYVSETLDRQKAESELLDVIKRIQAAPETQDFLQPPSQDRLLNALGSDTIVVLNATPYRSDAFVITKREGVAVVELTKLKFEELGKWTNSLKYSRPKINPAMLEWLWDSIARPILERLEFNQPGPPESLPRVIWVPTGQLVRMPIHAAGRHVGGSRETVLDTVMSSYSPSLRSFVLSREAKSRATATLGGASTEKALLIGMDKTLGPPKLPDLPFALKEVEMLGKMCTQLNIEPVRLPEQSREAVLANLDALVFHFAGHGQSHPTDPLQSGLNLEDGLLTVSDIQDHKLGAKQPFLGYLSACLTGTIDVDNLLDEGIHLISAFQLAGFRHVIGTLWQVHDDCCVEVAQLFYKHIAHGGMTDRSVCIALHKTILELRNRWITEQFSAACDKRSEGEVDDEESDSDLVGKNIKLDDGDDGDEEGTKKDGREKRNGRLKLGKATAGSFVKAAWVPYVHYGP
ncbi:hypothetical protein ABW19_dt0200828 [Dactylella cylindrospora]|nr:hypothetical protein ABW19_dt0200828 [Dactylella cylindrospora]